MKVVMGVQDMTYPRGHANAISGTTTAQVAESLEAKYHVMGVFAQHHKEDIASAVADMLVDRMTNHRIHRGVVYLPKVQHEFDRYLESMEHFGLTGTFVSAAQKRGTSFIDTGTYQQSVRVWIEP